MRLSPNAALVASVCALLTTGVAGAAGADEVGAGVASNDPNGQVLFVWLWLLPLSGILCIVAYVFVINVMNASIAKSAAQRGVEPKKLGLFV
jgi:hypothetical protein